MRRRTALCVLRSGSPKTPSSPMIDRITRFIKTYHDASMSLVATFELLLLLRLALTALTFSRGSWVLLAVYALFFRGRYENNMFVQGAVAHWTARIDAALSHQGTPPVVRRAWELGKAYTRRAYEVLDVKRYLGGRAGAARKAQ
ncbi:hypothetical protein KEM55_004210 [Ascosphaera atra]|nr:hypothetical protein KEM55_004210 [Ascosphaera atra]